MKGRPMDAMVERIERLEKSVRRFRWAGGAVVCLGLAALVMGQQAEPKEIPETFVVDTVRARSVIAESFLLGSGTELRGAWAMFGDVAAFVLYPPGMKLGDKKGKRGSLRLSVGPTTAMIEFEAKDGCNSTWKTSPDGSTIISLCNKDESSLSMWFASPELGTVFSMYDADGRKRAELTAITSGARFVLLDSEGQTRAILGQSKTINKTTRITLDRPESSLVLFDEKGSVLHQVP